VKENAVKQLSNTPLRNVDFDLHFKIQFYHTFYTGSFILYIPSYQINLSYFEPLSGVIHVFVQARSTVKTFFSMKKISQYGSQTIKNFMLISDLKEYFRKNTSEKSKAQKTFFSGELIQK
jgi:hypothetical protein